jgi:hypothetical protein
VGTCSGTHRGSNTECPGSTPARCHLQRRPTRSAQYWPYDTRAERVVYASKSPPASHFVLSSDPRGVQSPNIIRRLLISVTKHPDFVLIWHRRVCASWWWAVVNVGRDQGRFGTCMLLKYEAFSTPPDDDLLTNTSYRVGATWSQKVTLSLDMSFASPLWEIMSISHQKVGDCGARTNIESSVKKPFVITATGYAFSRPALMTILRPTSLAECVRPAGRRSPCISGCVHCIVSKRKVM